MKKIILFLVLLCSSIFAQVWNPPVTTTINELTFNPLDMFTNSSGIHILLKRNNGNIVYYRLNSQGMVTSSQNPTPFSTAGDFPNIKGSENQLFAIYKEGNFIKGKYSTNGGDSWINLPNNIPTTTNLCNGIDVVYNDQGVHLVWATRDSYPNYETRYFRLNTNTTPYQWVDEKNVTDVTNYQYGGNPSIALSTSRVHVSWNTAASDFPLRGFASSRDRLNLDWQTPQSSIYGSEESMFEKLLVRGSTLYLFYAQFVDFGAEFRLDLDYKTRETSEISWSGTSIELMTGLIETPHSFQISKSYDDKIHLIYQSGSAGSTTYYRDFNGSSWSVPFPLETSANLSSPVGISNAGNDTYVIWFNSNDGYIHYRQYDAAPLAPTNLSVVKSANNHPLLSWTQNNEPDVLQYKVYKKITAELGWQYLTTITTNSFEDFSEFYPLPDKAVILIMFITA